MEKKNKILIIILISLVLVAIGLAVYFVTRDEGLTDAIKFRNEYMELNGVEVGFGDLKYSEIEISKKNTFKYVTEEEAVNVMKTEKGIIYFGFPGCPWCRSLVPVLSRVAMESNVPVYYLNISDIRSTFQIQEGKLVNTKEGTKSYYDLLEIMDANLEDYFLEKDGKKYDTEEKRLYAPTIVAFDNGVINGIHVDTVPTQQSGFEPLKEEEVKELEKLIKDVINSNNSVCTHDKC